MCSILGKREIITIIVQEGDFNSSYMVISTLLKYTIYEYIRGSAFSGTQSDDSDTYYSVG